jgi:hypothetical protein
MGDGRSRSSLPELDPQMARPARMPARESGSAARLTAHTMSALSGRTDGASCVSALQLLVGIWSGSTKVKDPTWYQREA